MSNKKSIIIIIAITLTGVLAMISCTHKSQEIEVSFKSDIVPIFTASCVLNSGCHLGANSTNLELDLDSAVAYNALFAKELINISNPPASLLYVEVNSGEMPVPPIAPLPASQQSLILNWIKQGAKNN